MTTKKKILFLLQGLQIGGLENVVYNLSKAVNAKGIFDVEICCYDTLGTYLEDLEREGVKVHYIARKRGFDWTYPFKVAGLIRNRKIDVLHAHNYTACFYGALAAFLARKPMIYTEHDHSYASSAYVSIVGKILKKITSKRVCVSVEVKNALKKFGTIDDIEVVYNGIDENIFKSIGSEEKANKRQDLGFKKEDTLLGVVGRLDEMKNQTILLDMLAQLKQTAPNAKLIIVGRGKTELFLKSKVEKMGLTKNVSFMGEIRNVHNVLSMLDIFLLPSLSEGLPLSIIEAMASGLPVIASKVGGIPELITNDLNGYLVEAGNKNAFMEATEKLVKNTNTQKTMGRENRSKFLKTFSLSKMAHRYVEIYKALSCKTQTSGETCAE